MVTQWKRKQPFTESDLEEVQNVPPVHQTTHGHEERSKVLLRMLPRKLRPVNVTHSILLFTIAALICTIAAPASASHRVGGWEQIPNINTIEVQEIAGWAVAEHAMQANDGLQLKRVMSGMQQVVEGMKWKLWIDAVNGDGIECMYIAEVYDVPWTNNRTLEFFGPAQQSTQGMCNHPAAPPNSKAPQIAPSLLGLLTCWPLFLFI